MKCPELVVSLWSLQKRMITDPIETIHLIKRWGVVNLEIVGHSNPRILKRELKNSGLNITSVVLPPVNGLRKPELYTDLITSYLSLFDIDVFNVQTLHYYFKDDTAAKMKDLSIILSKIVDLLKDKKAKISYHPFPHDFVKFENQTILDRIIDFGFSDTFGLQLDTYWLNYSDIEPIQYASYPIHSIHLNERDDSQQSVLLGTYPVKVLKHISALQRHSGVKDIIWILENDSEEQHPDYDEFKTTMTIKASFKAWHQIWEDAQKYEITTKSDDSVSFKVLTDGKNEESKSEIEPYYEEVLVNKSQFDDEIDIATNELFRHEELEIIYPDDGILSYYSLQRLDRAKRRVKNHKCEEDFYLKFRPDLNQTSKRVISIVGKSGSGKSTFIRYFFQHYFPFRLKVRNPDLDLDSDEHQVHFDSYKKHIILYVDLRPGDMETDVADFTFRKLATSLFANRAQFEFDIEECEDENFRGWFGQQIYEIKKSHILNDQQGKYLSIVFDNSDQLDKRSQRRLYQLAKELKDFWKIIIPIRPETKRFVNIYTDPLNDEDRPFYLPSLELNQVIRLRGDWMHNLVHNSNKMSSYRIKGLLFIDNGLLRVRDGMDMKPSTENAIDFQNRIHEVVEGKIDDKIQTSNARDIIDKLIGDSARRGIKIKSKIALSDNYASQNYGRLRRKVSTFNFIDGLIRGDKEIFDESDDRVIVNFFNMTGSIEWEPKNLFIGLHILHFLNKKDSWGEVEEKLINLGYHKDSIILCRDVLIEREIMRGFPDEYEIEYKICEGHNALLKTTAFIDNMAIHSTGSWTKINTIDFSKPIPANFIKRIRGTINFIKLIWKSEFLLYKLPGNYREFREFDTYIKNLELPNFTYEIAKTYAEVIDKLYNGYSSIYSIVNNYKDEWDILVGELEKIIDLAQKNVEAYQDEDDKLDKYSEMRDITYY